MAAKIDTTPYRVVAGTAVDLDERPTDTPALYRSRPDYERTLRRHVERLSEQQAMLYADDRHALLLIFQAMDAAGKDGVIKHVMSGVNPQGCQVFSFKHPGAEELDHDFLWRTTRCLPERGRIGIFNRSYYEEVLIVRVHPEILQAQALPDDALAAEDFWQRRFESINGLERHLERNGTHVVKFFLHLSPEEQRRRFLARLDEPDKRWKFSQADLDERAHWPAYMKAYSACLAATSTPHAPWYVVPADDKQNARLIVSQVLLDTFERLELRYPAPALDAQAMKDARSALERARPGGGE
jgi:PPK2 family polyphosphate:nucleotide phosphotransferase